MVPVSPVLSGNNLQGEAPLRAGILCPALPLLLALAGPVPQLP